jgi:hypothetical protein
MEFKADVPVDFPQAGCGTFEFRFPDPRFAMQDLPLQVRGIDLVGVHQAQSSDSRRSQIKGDRRTERTGTYQQYRSAFQTQLPGLAHCGNEQVARVSEKLRR